MSYGKRLRRARERAGMTQAEVGEAVGVSESAVSNWERDLHRPEENLRRDLAELLGMDLPERARWREGPARGWGNVLRAYRRRHRLTQSDIARAVGGSRKTVSNWERGRHKPDLDTRAAIVATFGAPLDLSDREAVRAAARQAVACHRQNGYGGFDGPSADAIITGHTGGDMDRWSSLIRRALTRARDIEPAVSDEPEGRAA